MYWTPPVAGGGEVIRRELSPIHELDALKPTLLTHLVITQVQAVPVDGGVQVSWSRIPLQRVIGYEVLRQGPSGANSIVRRTKDSQFVDQTAVAGVKYRYSVRPVFAISLPEEASALIANVKGALLTNAAMLEQRAKNLNLMPPGAQLVRGKSTSARVSVGPM